MVNVLSDRNMEMLCKYVYCKKFYHTATVIYCGACGFLDTSGKPGVTVSALLIRQLNGFAWVITPLLL